MNIFKLTLDLQKLSSIAVAVNFWGLPTVKEKIHEVLLLNKIKGKLLEDWDNVIKYVITQTDLMCLPEKLLRDIQHFVEILGDKLYGWISYVMYFLQLDVKHAEKIYWTPIGEIDELRIVTEYWLSDEAELGNVTHECIWNKPQFCIASAYVQKDFINTHLEEMKAEIFKVLSDSGLDSNDTDWNDDMVMAAWLIFCRSKTKDDALYRFKNFNNSRDDNEAFERFSVAIKQDLFPVTYFFDKLKDKKEVLEYSILSCRLSMNIFALNGGNETENVERILKALIFFIKNKDDVAQLKSIKYRFCFFFTQFLYIWPYQEVCLKMLVDDPHYDPKIHDKLLGKIIEDLCSGFYKLKYFGKGPTFVQIFKTLLEIIPADVKDNVFRKKGYDCLNSLKIVSPDFFSVVLNDPDLDYYELSLIADMYLKNLILEGGQYKEVNKFMKVCLDEDEDEDEDKVKQTKYNFLSTFLTTGRMELAEEHLNWLGDSDSEKCESMKKQIDSVSICTTLIKEGRRDLADKYLKWQCGSEEEENNVKQIIISNGSLRDQIYVTWCMHRQADDYQLDEVKKECETLLDWFFESKEDMIEFRKTKLIEDEVMFLEKYCDNLIPHYLTLYNCIEGFLTFCFWSPERMDDLRHKIANNAEWWIDTYVGEKNRFRMVDLLFTWALNSREEEEMPDAILNYMESPKGAFLILKCFRRKDKETIRFLLNIWIRERHSIPSICISRVKMNLDFFNDGIMCKDAIFYIKSVLDELKKDKVTNWMLDNMVFDNEKLSDCHCFLGNSVDCEFYDF